MMDEPAPTTEDAKKISAISKESIHRICSGQVILDLCTAVKELVENSLDSGATVIEIKLVDYGKTSITVIDNGSGVLEKDFEGLGLKHHTSKLSDFSDLEEVETFGFRGEALSSLCALSDLNIITKHSTSPHAFDLRFNKEGQLVKKTECARRQGTTVHVRSIFKSLPVRAKEFHKNIKKEYSKMAQILHSYCLVSTGVKITCTNALGNKPSNVVFSTNGSNCVLDNVAAIFGRKARENLLEIELLPPDKEILEEYSLPSDISLNFTWKCFVSTCTHTMGRASPDRQFFFINSRPCDLPKVSRLINFTYHKYNNKQYPFVFLNILIEKSCADINVTPDKRTILLTQEKLIFAAVRSNFNKTWDNNQGVFTEKTKENLTLKLFKREMSSSPEGEPPSKKPTGESLNDSIDGNKVASNAMEDIKAKLLRLKSRGKKESIKTYICTEDTDEISSEDKNEDGVIDIKIVKICKEEKEEESGIETEESSAKEEMEVNRTVSSQNESFEDEVQAKEKLPDISMAVSLNSIKEKLDKMKEMKKLKENTKNTIEFKARLNSKTSDIEKELKDRLTGECFDKMEVIGQFNLGFILTKLDNNLFIVDQHASDEKYRFEKLSNETKLKTQKLIVPKPLNLAVIKESVLMDNQSIFESNGFTFVINDNEEIGNKVSLTGMPVSFGWQFSEDDIEELIFIIQEGGEDGTSSNVIPRPSRIRQMLASRACRSAVMIGTTLSHTKMRQIVQQMSEMKNPWTCPHGRPTLRHILTFVSSKTQS